MRIKIWKSKRERMLDKQNLGWHSWYAWHPIYLREKRMWVWLETVGRHYDSDRSWMYRTANEIALERLKPRQTRSEYEANME